jgi:hypothetical protein
MTIDVNCEWTPQPEAGDWASQNIMNFATDQIYKFNVGTTVQSEKITPKFLIIDNTNNAFALTLTMGVLDFTIPAGTRCSVGYPEGMTRFQIMSAGTTGTASVIIAEKKYIDDVSNQTAVVTPPTPGGNVSITRTRLTASGAHVVPADCYAFVVELVGGGGGGGTGTAAGGQGTGGGAGGMCRKLYTSPPGTNCTYVQGTGGGSNTDGNNSTFTDGVDLITATGGKKGNSTIGDDSGAGGVGGTGTNGDIAFSGNTGGSSDGAPGFGGVGGVRGNPGTAAAANTGAGGGPGDSSGITNGGAGGSGFCVITEYISA